MPGFRIRAEPLTICVPLPEVSPLTQQEREQIKKESDVNFLTEGDWRVIDNALCRYVLDLRQTREGNYDEISEVLKKIGKSASAFMASVTHKNEAEALAINRLNKAAGEELYGRIADVVSQATMGVNKALEGIKQELLLSKPDPLCGLVTAHREIFVVRGVPFACPKANDDYAKPKLSLAQKFMRSVLSKLPKEFQPNSIKNGSEAAFMANTARALSRSTKTGRPR